MKLAADDVLNHLYSLNVPNNQINGHNYIFKLSNKPPSKHHPNSMRYLVVTHPDSWDKLRGLEM